MNITRALFILRHGSYEGRIKYLEAVKTIEDELNRKTEELDLAKKAIIALTEERMKLLDNNTACDSCSCELLDARDKAIRESHLLADDNERLKEILDSYALQYGSAVTKERYLKSERAEAYKRFAERMKGQVFSGATPHDYELLHMCIDGIAKELTEGKNDE